MLAHLIRVLGGDFHLAEDALMDAIATALQRWPGDGVPNRPAAWLTTAARRKALDRLRRSSTRTQYAPELTLIATLEAMPEQTEQSDIPDEQLKLFFTCCHPALAVDAQVALTLRTLGGLSTPEIAAAFLVPVPTMAQRLVRAKKKIKVAKIPYRVPPRDELSERLTGVLKALYLVFNEGYSAHSGDRLVRVELCSEAIRLGRVLVRLLPEEPEVRGLLALMLLQDSRRDARTDADGVLISLDEQDRSLWHAAQIEQGLTLIQTALEERRPGPYQVQAAIAAVHAESASDAQTDWAQIAMLYDALLRLVPSAVVALNRAVALSLAGQLTVALQFINELEHDLADYQPFHAARADVLRRTGQLDAAAAAYDRAIELSSTPAERTWLVRQRDRLAQ